MTQPVNIRNGNISITQNIDVGINDAEISPEEASATIEVFRHNVNVVVNGARLGPEQFEYQIGQSQFVSYSEVSRRASQAPARTPSVPPSPTTPFAQVNSNQSNAVRLFCAEMETELNTRRAAARLAGVAPGEPISAARNRDIIRSVLQVMAISQHGLICNMPIITNSQARTALAHTRRFLQGSNDFLYIGVSPDWDLNASQSPYWGSIYSRPEYHMNPNDPVFSDSFKTNLLIHEMLHQIEAESGLDINSFNAAVDAWYRNSTSGDPNNTSSGNYTKYILWWNLYGHTNDYTSRVYRGDYAGSLAGVEEFAYIGERLASTGGNAGRDIPISILRFYEGILSPSILAQARLQVRS
ncbi:MAG: hypothetical protein JNK65_03380 [Deltaproteobacteria bacterium]|nr:hypothetical protein [Deltaproteobacteria bacterium]